MNRLVLALVLTAACTVDTDDLPIDDYASWASIEVSGDAPPHSDSYRVIYVNDVALSWAGYDAYPLGSVIVKEILEEGPGSGIDYIAIMRRLDDEPPGGSLEGGWLFTRTSSIGSDELQGATCWKTCHVQAPFQGTWLDYSTN